MAMAVIGDDAGAQVDAHAVPRVFEEGHILVQTTVERVDPGATGEPVHPGAAHQQVVAVISFELVVAVATGQAVVAGATPQPVVAAPAVELVIAASAFQHVASAVASQHVVEDRADDTFDLDQRVAARPTGGRAQRQVDLHAGNCRRRAGQITLEIAVIGHVDALAAIQRVVTLAACEHVVATVAGQAVSGGRPDHMVDVAQRVIAVGTAGRAQGQVDDDGTGGMGVDHHVVGAVLRRILAGAVDHVIAGAAFEQVATVPAFQRVVAAAALQQVVTTAAGQPVVAAITDQFVVMHRPEHALEPAEGVVAGAAGGHAGGQVHPHAGRGHRGRLAPRPPDFVVVQLVDPGATRQVIIAGPAGDHVVAIRSDDGVVVAAADHMFDVQQGVVAVANGGARSQIDRDRPGRRGEHRDIIQTGLGAAIAVERVIPGAADQQVAAVAAHQHVVAGSAGQPVLAGVAGQGVVERAALDVLDRQQQVRPHVATHGLRVGAAQVDGDGGRCTDVGHDVPVIAAFQAVVAGVADEQVFTAIADQLVVARPAGDLVAPRATDQGVVEGRAGEHHTLDVDQPVDTAQAVGQHLRATTAHRRRTEEHAAGQRQFVEPVGHDVGTFAAVEHVVAGVAAQVVVAGTAQQGVVARIAAQQVVAGATIQHIGAVDAGRVETAVVLQPEQRVVAVVAGQRVAAAAADQDIGVRRPRQNIVVVVTGDRCHVPEAPQLPSFAGFSSFDSARRWSARLGKALASPNLPTA